MSVGHCLVIFEPLAIFPDMYCCDSLLDKFVDVRSEDAFFHSSELVKFRTIIVYNLKRN